MPKLREHVRGWLTMSGIVIPFVWLFYRTLDLSISYQYSVLEPERIPAIIEQYPVVFRQYGIVACLVVPLALLLLLRTLQRGSTTKEVGPSHALRYAAFVCLINLAVLVMFVCGAKRAFRRESLQEPMPKDVIGLFDSERIPFGRTMDEVNDIEGKTHKREHR